MARIRFSRHATLANGITQVHDSGAQGASLGYPTKVVVSWIAWLHRWATSPLPTPAEVLPYIFPNLLIFGFVRSVFDAGRSCPGMTWPQSPPRTAIFRFVRAILS